MLEVIFGSQAAERVLLYLHNYDDGYARAIAHTFQTPLFAVQRQLRRLEAGGVLVSRLVGRTRVYTWNPRYPLRETLRALLSAAFQYIPPDEVRRYYRERRRPRRAGKPL